MTDPPVVLAFALGVGVGKIKNKNNILEVVRWSFELEFGSNDIYAARRVQFRHLLYKTWNTKFETNAFLELTR